MGIETLLLLPPPLFVASVAVVESVGAVAVVAIVAVSANSTDQIADWAS